jgi:hypothetical protein
VYVVEKVGASDGDDFALNWFFADVAFVNGGHVGIINCVRMFAKWRQKIPQAAKRGGSCTGRSGGQCFLEQGDHLLALLWSGSGGFGGSSR